jgi:hypothetical protein
MVITNSPNVSIFGFTACLDISGVTPKATLVDISTYIGGGAANIIGINFKLVDPSNLTFHNTIYPPDTDIAAHGTEEVNLPIFANAVKWGIYKIYATLIDEDGTQYIWEEGGLTYKSINLCKPNTLEGAKGNFGALDLVVDFNCDTANLFVSNNTSFSYKGINPSETETAIVVTFPADSTGAIATQTAPFLPFMLPFSLTGTYSISGQITQTYQITDTTCVIAGYKYSKSFEVSCGFTLCKAFCEYNKLKDEVKNCVKSTPESISKEKQLVLITALLMEAVAFKYCGQKLGNILEEIRTIGGFNCDCDCNPQGIAPMPVFVNGTIVKGNMCGDIDMQITQFEGNVKIDLSDRSYILQPSAESASYTTVTRIDGVCSSTFYINVDVCAAVAACELNLTWIDLEQYLEEGYTTEDAFYAIDIYGIVHIRGKIVAETISSGASVFAVLPIDNDITSDQKYRSGGLDTQALSVNPYEVSFSSSSNLIVSVETGASDFQFYINGQFYTR